MEVQAEGEAEADLVPCGHPHEVLEPTRRRELLRATGLLGQVGASQQVEAPGRGGRGGLAGAAWGPDHFASNAPLRVLR